MLKNILLHNPLLFLFFFKELEIKLELILIKR